jgi:hypothetical protein
VDQLMVVFVGKCARSLYAHTIPRATSWPDRSAVICSSISSRRVQLPGVSFPPAFQFACDCGSQN